MGGCQPGGGIAHFRSRIGRRGLSAVETGSTPHVSRASGAFMKVAVVKEHCPGERRVALVPAAIGPLVTGGHEILVGRYPGIQAGALLKRQGERDVRAASLDQQVPRAA